ncbi:MAG TPA: DUF3108 domain-containing protein [Blastocatellia bacterium]|nr:DUF3108 domain-containing protein [Blastocatellia bacterium]
MRNVLLLITLVSFVFCACKPKPRVPAAAAAPKVLAPRRDATPLPFPAQEKLTYELRFTRVPLSISAGTIVFQSVGISSQPTIEKLEFKPQPNDRLLHLRAAITAKGLLLRLFGLSVNDRFETLVDAKDFKMRAVLREIEEGKKHNLQTGIFDYTTNEANYRTLDMNNLAAGAREKVVKLEPDMQDLLSAFYLLRLQELKEGVTYKFPLVYEGERKDFDLLVHGREEVDTDVGKFKTVKIQAGLFGPGRLSTREGEFFLWVTDDASRTPVKLQAKASGATITATLNKKE